MLYLFYLSYSRQGNLLTQASENENNLKQLTKNNYDKIEKLDKIINKLNTNLEEININMRSSSEDKEVKLSDETKNFFENILNEINLIKTDIKNIKEEAKSISNSSNNLSNKKQNSRTHEIIDLIKIKFENGNDFEKEIDLLNSIKTNNTQSLIEKLYIINNQKFAGNEQLQIHFKNETNEYLSNVFIEKNWIIKNIISYIDIQPANKNNISNPVIINLKNIKNLLLKKQYAKSVVTIKDLDTDGIYFKRSLEQLRIGERFYITINSIKKNG